MQHDKQTHSIVRIRAARRSLSTQVAMAGLREEVTSRHAWLLTDHCSTDK